MKTRPVFVIVWWIAALLGVAGAASAQNAQNAPPPPPPAPVRAEAKPQSPGSMGMQAPASSDVIFIIKDAGRLRSAPVGHVLHDLISRAGLLADTRKSWDALAKTLGWTREEAFDRLLGGQVMVVVSGIYEEGNDVSRWAIVSHVDEETDKRLLEKLAAAPRGNAAGHQLLSVEHGEYELAVHRPGDGGEGRAGAGARVIVLGPHKRPELFDRVLRALNDAPGPGESPIFLTAVASSLKELDGADAIVLVKMELEDPNDAKAAADPWSAHAALSLTTDDKGLGMRCIINDPTATKMLNGGAGGPPVDLDAAFTGALIATVEHRLNGALEPDSPLTELLAKVRMPEPLRQSLASGQMFVARTSPAPPGVACGLAIHVKDPVATAKEADAFMAGLIRHIEGDPRPGGQVAAMDFAGVAPRAVRSLPVDAWSAIPGLNWPELWASWSYAPMGPPEPKNAEPVKAVAQAAPEPGWWVIGVAGGKSEEPGAGRMLANDIVEQLHAAAPANVPGHVLSQGVVRPAALAKAIWPGVPDLMSWRDVFGRVSVIRWQFECAAAGRMDGTVRIDLTPAPAPPPAPPAGLAR